MASWARIAVSSAASVEVAASAVGKVMEGGTLLSIVLASAAELAMLTRPLMVAVWASIVAVC